MQFFSSSFNLNYLGLHTVNLFHEQHSKNWAKRIQGEWKSLEKDLPGES